MEEQKSDNTEKKNTSSGLGEAIAAIAVILAKKGCEKGWEVFQEWRKNRKDKKKNGENKAA